MIEDIYCTLYIFIKKHNLGKLFKYFNIIELLKFQGTSADQDTRFSDKEKKLLKQMKFSESLNAKVFHLK